MLILTRKKDEEIRINSNITIKIVSLTENNVKIGIEAPSEVVILRGEIYQRVKESTLEASTRVQEKLTDVSKLKINKIGK
ncbi:MAG: carbon storage regulator CsrA [Bacteroidetes bacterium]|nr:carbon storage regulator CsrA [Bacteroidota bacterium]